MIHGPPTVLLHRSIKIRVDSSDHLEERRGSVLPVDSLRPLIDLQPASFMRNNLCEPETLTDLSEPARVEKRRLKEQELPNKDTT